MAPDNFLELVLPKDGNYYIARKTGENFRQYIATSIDNAKARIENGKTSADIYYATGSFKKKRTKADCKNKKCFYIDIDCHKGGQYDSKKEAITAIKAALKNGLPVPTLLVDSGHGVHAYWVLEKEILRSEWQPYANALITACSNYSLRIDKEITKDPARLLRVPSTFNFRDPDHPQACTLLDFNGPTYDFADFAELLNEFLTGPAPIPTKALVDNSDLTEGIATGKPALAKDMIERCPLFKETREIKGKGQPGVLWHNILHTLAYCDDGAEYIHALSSAHEEYVHADVERRFAISTAQKESDDPNRPKPTTCATFSNHTNICKTCKYWGHITSPIKLAFSEPSELPWPYRNATNEQGKDVVQRYEYAEEGEGWVDYLPWSLRDLRVAHTPGESPQMRFRLSDQTVGTTIDDWVDFRAFSVTIGNQGFMPSIQHFKRLREIMESWVEQLRARNETSVAAKKFGWGEEGFRVGDKLYLNSGSVIEGFGPDWTLSQDYLPRGSLEEWRARAQHILDQDRPALWCGIAAAFGAPLTLYTGLQGTMLSIVSPQSGTGKTTALRIGQSVWAHPTRAMATLNDTPNAVNHRLGILSHLPAYWDELRGHKDVMAFVQLLFRLSQGKEKQRLTAQITQRQSGNWSTMLTVASNESVRSYVTQVIGASDAGAARVFEIEATPATDPTYNDADARHFFDGVHKNYGVAGAVYAAYLAENRDKVEQALRKADSLFSELLQGENSTRFWVALIACLYTGASIANKTGVCEFNLNRLRDYLIGQFRILRSDKERDYKFGSGDVVEILTRYLIEMHDHIILAENLPKKGGKNKITVVADRNPVVARIATVDKKVRVSIRDFESWIFERVGMSPKFVVNQLVQFGAKRVRGSISAGSPKATSGRIACLDIPMVGNFAEIWQDE